MPSIGLISPAPRTDGTGGDWAGLAEGTAFTFGFACSLTETKDVDLVRPNQKITPNTPAIINTNKMPASAREDRTLLLIQFKDWRSDSGLKSNLCSLNNFLFGVFGCAWTSFFGFSFSLI